MSETTPVLVGIAQILQRGGDDGSVAPPLGLMIDAVRAALEDAEAPALAARIGSIRVIKGIWGYKNPALAIAEALGCGRVETGISVLGGNHVQMVLNRSALEIQAGERDVVVLAGAECGRSMGRAQKAGLPIEWLEPREDDPTPQPDVEYGDRRWTRHEVEMKLGLQRPVSYYALFETALRHRRGETVTAHRDRIARLWAGFAAVARDNPHAWIRREVTAEEIATPSARNRPISSPYPMLMNANMRVDMGAALVLCSLDTARAAGVPEHKRVYPVAGADAYDHLFVSERDTLTSSPAIRFAGRAALELAGLEVSDLDLVDVYSCFPSAVQVAVEELGLGYQRPLTVTGGLTFGGGPLNNYVMHSIARTAELLRQRPGARALVTANGGMLTKHSFGVYSSAPPGHEFRHRSLQAEVDREPRRELATAYTGPAEIESYTVAFGEGGAGAKPATSYTAIYGKVSATGSEPTLAHLACRLPDGRRAWANLEDPELLAAMCVEEFCGRPLELRGDGVPRLA